VVQPEGYPPPRGYSNGMVASGRFLTVGGQIGWELDGSFASDDLIDQFARALDHVLAVVAAAGGQPEHIMSMTIFVTDIDAYRRDYKRLGPVWRERLGKHYPAMALIGVSELVEPRAKVEIQAVAALPEESS
jgi:enamine deaminase RidA (YjgF/YER057c/UK114 family)